MLDRGIDGKALLGGSCCTAGSNVEWDQEKKVIMIMEDCQLALLQWLP